MYAFLSVFNEMRFYQLYDSYESHVPSRASYYFGGARSKGFATLRNVLKLQFFAKIGHAKSVGFRIYSLI